MYSETPQTRPPTTEDDSTPLPTNAPAPTSDDETPVPTGGDDTPTATGHNTQAPTGDRNTPTAAGDSSTSTAAGDRSTSTVAGGATSGVSGGSDAPALTDVPEPLTPLQVYRRSLDGLSGFDVVERAALNTARIGEAEAHRLIDIAHLNAMACMTPLPHANAVPVKPNRSSVHRGRWTAPT